MNLEMNKVREINHAYSQKDNVEKEDLLRLLACLQSELEAREDVINTLRLERLQSINFRAKYGFGDIEKSECNDSKDPYFALQRDSLIAPTNSSNAEADLKPLYDTQLVQLENLITSQRRAQDTMREQLMIMESKYLKVCKELEDERSKHERDAAQGDDVLVMLEKERERLKSEVEYERGLNKKLEKDLRRVLQALKEQAFLLNTQKMAAVSIIKERLRLCRDRKFKNDQQPNSLSASANMQTAAMTNIDVQDSSVKRDESAGSHENHSVNTSGVGDSTFLSKECTRLRRLLTDEISARKALEERFERLQKEHQNLLSTSNIKDASNESAVSGSPTISSDALRNLTVDKSLISSPSVTGSNASTQRPKPNPPMRRSSEISNMSGMASPTNLTTVSDHSLGLSELNVQIDSGSQTGNLSVGEAHTGAPTVTPTSPLNSVATSTTTNSSSRSSTPSPPPPPPPIQLHYPYPGMQSHLHHGQSRNPSTHSPFVPNATRPTSGSILHATATKSGPTLSTHGSRTANSPYQTPFVPLSPQIQTNRMSFTPSARGSASRKSPAIIAHSSPTDTTPSMSNYPSPYLPSQTKSSPPNQSQYPPRSPAQHFLSSSGGHHFPAYPALRQNASSGSTSTDLNNTRSVRSSVPPASSSLTSSGGPLGSGHVCINGK